MSQLHPCTLLLPRPPLEPSSRPFRPHPRYPTNDFHPSHPCPRPPSLPPLSRYPTTETVFEYFVDPKARTWAPWESKLSATYKPPADQPFFKIMVPTVDTVRSKFVASALVRVQQHTLIVGNVGVGKTMIVQSLLEGLPADKGHMVINFSAQTSSNSLQVRCGVRPEGGGEGEGTGGRLVAGGAACIQGSHGHQFLGTSVLQLAAGEGRGTWGVGRRRAHAVDVLPGKPCRSTVRYTIVQPPQAAVHRSR